MIGDRGGGRLGWSPRPLGQALQHLGVVLFPPSCHGCQQRLVSQPRHGLCAACFEILEPNLGRRCPGCDLPRREHEASTCPRCERTPLPLLSVRAPWLYGGPAVELIAAAKFYRHEDAAAAMGVLLEAGLERELVQALPPHSCLVPIPLGQRRARWRGFNQSAVMARYLGRRWNLPVRHALRRLRETSPQSDLPLQARARNVANAFAPIHRVCRRLRGHVVLIDDVVTSTETLRAAAAALAEYDVAGQVSALALARAE